MPIIAVFGCTILFVVFCKFFGMGLAARVKTPLAREESVGSVVGATVGLLAFMLAFTFNMTANRFDARKQLVLDEANAIETTYLRAGLLPEEFTAPARALLREYVDLRVRAARDRTTLDASLARSEAIHDELWASVEDMFSEAPAPISYSLFVNSLNEMIDVHAERVTVAVRQGIPGAIWMGLYLVAGLAMIAVGYQTGKGGQRPYLVNTVLALAFSVVILLILDLDRSWEGAVRVDQQPLIDLQKKLGAAS